MAMIHNESIDKRIAEQPIYFPDHPYIAKLKDLGVDELIAAFVDPVSTTILSGTLSEGLKPYILPLTGPIAEKFTFFIRHGLEARKIYKTTPESKRKEYGFYLKERLAHGRDNMVKDIIYHDPMYISLMSLGLRMFPEIPAGVISVASYTISVFAAVGLDVGIDEFKHYKGIQKLKRAGFGHEKYYESRFYISTEKDPADALEGLIKEFNISDIGSANYKDIYFDVNENGFSGRKIKMRLRSRDKMPFEKGPIYAQRWLEASGNNPNISQDDEKLNTLQIIYTRSTEQKSKTLDQCRYFVSKKEKLYTIVESDANSLENISNGNVVNAVKKKVLSDNRNQIITFDRTVARNEEMAICIDKVNTKRPFYVLELKTYNDTRLLMQAMRYVMSECPLAVTQTTYGKSDMIL